MVLMTLEVVQPVNEDGTRGDQGFHEGQEHGPNYDEHQVLWCFKFRSVSPILLEVLSLKHLNLPSHEHPEERYKLSEYVHVNWDLNSASDDQQHFECGV